jgi:hypothetical protein
MIYTKTNIKGVDVPIQRLQDYLYNALDIDGHVSYGRCYKNNRNGQVIPEYFKGKKEYVDVLFDDRHPMTSFAIVDNTVEFEERASQEISFIFQANLKSVFNDNLERSDEQLTNNIATLLFNNPWDYKLKSIKTGVEDVYREFGLEAIAFTDMQDFFVVRFDIDVIYDYDCNY